MANKIVFVIAIISALVFAAAAVSGTASTVNSNEDIGESITCTVCHKTDRMIQYLIYHSIYWDEVKAFGELECNANPFDFDPEQCIKDADASVERVRNETFNEWDPVRVCREQNICPNTTTTTTKFDSLALDSDVVAMFDELREEFDVQTMLSSPEAGLPSCCGTCRNITLRLSSLLKNPKLHAALDKIVAAPCYFRTDKHACEVPRIAKLEQLLANLTLKVDNSKICDTCCGHNESALIEEVLSNPLDCLNCKLIANIIRQALLAGRTKEQILSDCLAFCSKLFPKTVADSCTNLIQSQLDQFIDIVQKNNGNAELACQAFGKCKKVV